jgi:hypothetical protein
METVWFSEILLSTYEFTRGHNPEEQYRQEGTSSCHSGNFILGDIWSSHGGEYEDGCLMCCCAVYMVEVCRRFGGASTILHGEITQKTAILNLILLCFSFNYNNKLFKSYRVWLYGCTCRLQLHISVLLAVSCYTNSFIKLRNTSKRNPPKPCTCNK